MDCKKCNGPGILTLRKRDPYCSNCFLANTNHKFRACIGKNKILSSNEKVLICLSEGVSSVVLLDLIHSGVNMDNHKKLRIIPCFLHLIDISSKHVTQAENILEQCRKYKFDVYVSNISNYMEMDIDMPQINCAPQINKDTEDKFHAMLKSMPATARNDFLKKIKRNLFTRFAELLQCNSIFTAETTSTLAINILSNLALGRGSQIENDIGFCDTRNGHIKILRPMRDISKEELDHYINIKQLSTLGCSDKQENSLQSVIGSFVTDLQENFQATISTLCKTADKIGVHDDIETERKCVLCESDLGTENFNLTALAATNFSETVSHGSQNLDKSNSTTLEIIEGQDMKPMMFKLIHKKLCYGCSRNFLEMKESALPNHVQKILYDT